MKRLLQNLTLLFLFTVTTSVVFAQNTVQLKQVWRKHIRGTSDDFLHDMAVHPDGSILVAGRYTGSTTDVNAPAGNLLAASTAVDAYAIHYQSNGALASFNKLNVNTNDEFATATFGLDKTGYFLGGGKSTASNNYIYRQLLIASLHPSNNTLTSSISTDGSGTTPNNFLTSTTDNAGFIYAGGAVNGTIDVNASRGNMFLVSSSGNPQNAVIVKHHPDRSVRWAISIGGANTDVCYGITVRGNAVYAVGTFTGTVDFDPGAGVFNLSSGNASTENGFLLKLDTAGNFLNAWSFSSSNRTVWNDVEVNANGDIFISGFFNGSADIDPGAGTTTINTNGGISEDPVLVKLNANGNLVWYRTFGGLNTDMFLRLAMDRSSNIYASGYFNSPSINVGFPQTNTLTNASSTGSTSDGFFVGYDSSGTTLFGHRIGGTANDAITSIGIDSAYNIYVAGQFNSSSVQTELYQGFISTITSGGGYDGFVVKYSTLCPVIINEPSLVGGCNGATTRLSAFALGTNNTYQWLFNGSPITAGTKYPNAANDTLLITSFGVADSGSYRLVVSSPGCVSDSSALITIFPNNAPLSQSMTHFYMLNGSTADAVQGATSAIMNLSGGYTSNRFGRANSAANLTSNFENIYLNSSVNNTQSSYALWYQPSAYTMFDRLIIGTTSTNAEFHMGLNAQGELGYKFAGIFYGSGIVLNNDTWYHLVMVKNGTNLKYYVNNQLVFETNNAFSQVSAPTAYLLGNGNGSFASGRVDDLRVYQNRALSVFDIQAIYTGVEFISSTTNTFSCLGSSISQEFVYEGSGLRYQWQKDNVELTNGSSYSGSISDSLIILNVSLSEQGTYKLKVMQDTTVPCLTVISDSVSVYVGTPDLNTGFVHYYTFDQSATDRVGNNNLTGTVSYAGSNDRYNSGSGRSVNMNTSSVPLTFSSPVMRDTMSLSLWYLTTSLNTNRTLLSPSSGNARFLRISSTNEFGFTNGSGTFIPSSAKMAVNTWYHLVVVKAGTFQQLYVNGRLVLESTNSFSANNVINALALVGFGAGNTERASGFIDDFRVFSRMLSGTDVNGLYRSIEIVSNSGNATACLGFDNVVFTARPIQQNVSLYQTAWRLNGNNITNGSKYSGVDNDTLTITNLLYPDTGLYNMVVWPTGFQCITRESASQRININTPSLIDNNLRWHIRFNNNSQDYGPLKQHASGTVPHTTGLNNDANGAGNFNGTSTFLQSPNMIPAGNQYSFSVWFKSNAGFGSLVSTANALPGGSAPTSFKPILYIGSDNKLKGKVYDGNTGMITSSNDVNDNVWHMATLVVNGTVQSLYLDGAFVANVLGNASALDNQFLVGTAFTTGYPNAVTGWFYFQGSMDELRVYNRALSDIEISRLYHSHGFSVTGERSIIQCPGNQALLTSHAVGTNLSYTWKRNGVALTNSANITGTDSSTLLIRNAQLADLGKYTVEISRNCVTLVSDTINLQILTPPSVTTQPTAITTCVGNTANFSVVAQGTNITYQWKRNGVNLTNGGNISGATSASLSVSNIINTDTGNYYCVITNSCGTDSSAFARLNINNGLQILQAPQATAICQNSNSFLVVRTSDASASYVWKKNNITINGSNNDTLFLNNVQFADSGMYKVVVNSVCGNDSTTNQFVSVLRATTITTQPTATTTICSGNNLILRTVANGTNLTYQWRKNGVAITGATRDSLILPAIQMTDSGNYVCEVTGTCGVLISNIARVNVNLSNTILTQPVAMQNVCVGNNAIITVSAQGPNPFYVWQRNGVTITGVNNDTLFRNNVTIAGDTGNYTVEIFGGSCPTARSTVSRINVFSNPVITSQPAHTSTCLGKPVSLSVTAVGSGLQYQWRKNGVDINGATGSSFTINQYVLADSGDYTCFISSNCGNTTSQVAQVRLASPLAITTQPISNLIICSGTSANVQLGVVTTGTVLGYQWFRNGVAIVNNPGSGITGATSANLVFVNTTLGAGNYSVKIYGPCDTLTSNTTVFGYRPLPSFAVQPQSATICSGTDVQFSTVVNNATSLRWFLDGVGMLDAPNKISGAFTDTLRGTSITAADLGGNNTVNLRLLASNGCGSSQNVNSNIVTLTILNSLAITTQSPAAINGCEGNNVVVYVNANIPSATYQWKKNGVAISGQTNDTLFLNTIAKADTGNYTCDITSNCGSLTSAAVAVAVNAKPTPTITRNGNNLTTGTFSNYQWLKDGVFVSGANQQSFTPTSNGIYAVRVSDANGCEATSESYNFFFTGMSSISGNQLINLFPNPASSQITLTGNSSETYTVELYTVAGVKVKQIVFERAASIDIADLSAGVYIVKATNSDGALHQFRLVKQ